MSTRPGYIGGYVDTEVKTRFVQEAENNGMNQTDFLNSILDTHFGSSKNYDTLDEEELDAFLSGDREEWDKIGPLLLKQLNCFILEAHRETSSESNLHLPHFLETLGDMLQKESDNKVDYNCEDDDDFEAILPENLSNEVITIIARTIREFGVSTPSKEQLFTLASSFLNQRADTLYVDARRLTIKFTREEWYYLDKLLQEVSESNQQDFPDLPTYLRYKLGEMLEYSGRGFLAPRDKGMVELGRQMMG